MRSQPEYLMRLHEILAKRFDGEELRTLCFGLGIDYDDLKGEGKSAKARELVAFLERHGRIAELVARGKQLCPDVAWDVDDAAIPPPTASPRPEQLQNRKWNWLIVSSLVLFLLFLASFLGNILTRFGLNANLQPLAVGATTMNPVPTLDIAANQITKTIFPLPSITPMPVKAPTVQEVNTCSQALPLKEVSYIIKYDDYTTYIDQGTGDYAISFDLSSNQWC